MFFASSGAVGGANGVGTAASFNDPRGVALDASFLTLFVSEAGGNRIRAVDVASALVRTIAGSGSSGFSDAFGLAAAFSFPFCCASAE